MPQVSVLMPCFNAADTLEETLQTIAGQTSQDYEVVAIDDGSSDATPDILASWADRDKRFHWLRLPHSGIIPALNAGLAECRAEFVARMDADDRMHPARLEKQAAFFGSNPDVALVSSLVSGFPAGELAEGFRIYIEWLNSLTAHAEICREIYIESPFCHPSVMFRKQAVVALGGYQERGWPEDYDLWLRMHQAGYRFAKVPEALLEWREHPNRLTRTDSRYSLENFLRAKAYYMANGLLKEYDGVFIWGAGMHGRRFGKQLVRAGVSLVAYIDIDPKKIGRTRRGLPILAPDELSAWWARFSNPVLLSAVAARGARPLIRQQLTNLGLVEGKDWWAAA